MSGSSLSATPSSSSSSSSSAIRAWRTAFLTLRDETLTSSPKSKSITQLLNDLIFSHSRALISAAPDLPPHEVTSDLLFLMEMAASSPSGQDVSPIYVHVSSMVYDICKRQRVPLQLNSSSWVVVINCFSAMVQSFLGQAGSRSQFSSGALLVGHVVECLGTVRCLASVYQQKCLLSDNVHLVKFLLGVIESYHAQCLLSTCTSNSEKAAVSTGKRLSKSSQLWEVPIAASALLSETFTRIGSSLPTYIWQSAMEVIRKLMDVLVSRNFLVEGALASRFYAALLGCLHLVLTNAKGFQNDHAPAFVATLRMFFTYGLPQSLHSTNVDTHKNAAKLISAETKKERTPYRPPHLRRKETVNMKQLKAQDLYCSSDQESFSLELISSDSDCSDSDGSVEDNDTIQSSKVRTAAIICLQDLCQADPRSFTTHWTMILPTMDVLAPRKFEANLLTCLLFDPYLKVRMATASTLAVMLDGPSSVFLQVAEYKESSKRGPFMALSSSLGLILMQLHTGLLYSIQRETHSRLLASLLKILVLLISATPYSRMPDDLLPRIIESLLAGMEHGLSPKGDQIGLLAASMNCLTATLSTSPSSLVVKQMLMEEIAKGALVDKNVSGVLSTIFRYSDRLTSPTICFEALQALRAVIHNYPTTAPACWERVTNFVSDVLRASTVEVSSTTCQGSEYNIGFVGEKVITSAIKVVDESLRAISGFKGTEELDEKVSDTPFTYDCIRAKKVSSAPLHELENGADNEDKSEACETGSEHWSQTIQWLMPQILQHNSSMVRTASITCFAGITSAVFGTLSKEKQDFVVQSCISAAVHDKVASVRSAACRAIGVISCFPKISHSAEILDKFVNTIGMNTHDPLASVRIAASWALANICDSLRHCVNDFPPRQSAGSDSNSNVVLFLMECALYLTKNGDKIKSNAVRALGNLSRFVQCIDTSEGDDQLVKYNKLSANKEGIRGRNTRLAGHGSGSSCYCTSSGHACLLQRMVQAFLSCVTTGNVKVQWNVCHAISNLFLNESLRLQDRDWAPSVFSILLLLLRDSSNFKIRIQAAAALAVPASVLDYGESFPDVVQGLEHVLENLTSDQISAPSSFKYRVALEKQVTATMLHVLSLTSSSDHQSVKDFLVKKGLYLEEWFKLLCSSIVETSSQLEDENAIGIGSRKKLMILEAVQSLIQVYERSNRDAVAEKFKRLERR